jgi:hypothetical protein
MLLNADLCKVITTEESEIDLKSIVDGVVGTVV